MSIQPVSQPGITSSLELSGAIKSEASTANRRTDLAAAPPADTTAADAAVAAARAPAQERVQEAAARIRAFVQPINNSIQFSVDEESGRTVVKVVDLQTKEVLRQIPSEEALDIANALDRLQGLLIQNKA